MLQSYGRFYVCDSLAILVSRRNTASVVSIDKDDTVAGEITL
jgi:hypothetical protein